MPLLCMDKYISLLEVLDNILDHPLLKDVSLERAINYTVHFMRIVGAPKMFLEKTAIIDIDSYRGLLPCDYNSMIQVRTHRVCRNKDYKVFRYSTDDFHMSDNKQKSFDLTYKLQGNVIFTSLKEGQIEISYNAFAVDENGYPLIPDDSAFIRALELYIKKQRFTILFDMGKITPQVLQQTQQDYHWAVGQAQASLTMPSIDQMQSIANSLNTLIPRVTEHRKGFVDNGTQELIKVN